MNNFTVLFNNISNITQNEVITIFVREPFNSNTNIRYNFKKTQWNDFILEYTLTDYQYDGSSTHSVCINDLNQLYDIVFSMFSTLQTIPYWNYKKEINRILFPLCPEEIINSTRKRKFKV